MDVIQTDTRQKMNKKHHKAKEAYFEAQGYKVVHSKMYVGDYCIPSNGSVAVDTKHGMQEVYGNLIQGHERFAREAERAFQAGITLYILIEDEEIECLDEVISWRNPRLRRWNKINAMHKMGKWLNVPLPHGRPPVNNLTLLKIMRTFSASHNVRWEFCRPEDAGRRVLELLTRRGK